MSWALETDPVRDSGITGRIRRTRVHSADREPPAIELWIDGVFETTEPLKQGDPEPYEFRISLPEFCFDADEHSLEIRFSGQSRTQQFRSEYDGFIDPFSENLIGGWVLDLSRPNTAVPIEIDVNGRTVGRVLANVFREHLLRRAGWRGFNGFRFTLPESSGLQKSFVLRARVAGTDIDLQRSPVLSIARPRLVRAAQQFHQAFHYLEQRLLWQQGGLGPEVKLSAEERVQFAELLLKDSHLADILELRRRFLMPVQAQLAEQYARRDYGTLGSDYPLSLPRRARHAHRDRPVDVIVPVYAGYRQTERCLQSVLHSAAGCRYELICVLDDPRRDDLRQLLQQLAGRHSHVTFVDKAETSGFADTVNEAMRRHRDRDVCLLHADCEVHGDWLGRLQRTAYAGTGAGLVCPMANAAEFFHYPAAGSPLPDDACFEELDAIAKVANRHITVPLPAALGHCLYVRRGCLDDLGFFHNDEAGGGYYAEKYFSVNAAAQGWRTVLAGDVFVKHHGGVSFSRRDQTAVEAARDAFERWCPFYLDSVTDFLVDDPALPCRRELDAARLEKHLASLGTLVVCFVSHAGGGGTERHLQDLAEALALDSATALILYSLPDGRVQIRTAVLEGVENLIYDLAHETEFLERDLKRMAVRHMHLHSNVDVAAALFELPKKLGVPYDITVHDYGWFCPRVNLINHSGQYCGEPPLAICNACTGTDVGTLLATSQQLLSGARRVFCPSEDVRDRLARHFILGNLVVQPHPEQITEALPAAVPAISGSTVTVAIIGRLSGHKGLRVVAQCAAHALEWALPLRFVVIGGTSDDARFERMPNVHIHGAYREEEADSLMEHYNVQVALLPSVWPETYSYTLSIALRNGAVPVAFDLGAIAERMRRASIGKLLPLGTPAPEINQALLQAALDNTTRPIIRGTGCASALRDYYGFESHSRLEK